MVPSRFSTVRCGTCAALAASAVCLGLPTYAAAARAALPSAAFSQVPSRDRLVAIAWEDLTDPSLSLTVPTPLSVVTMAKARAETWVGPALVPGGRGWFTGMPADMAGTRGEVVFEFRGPGGQVLCAASPVLRVPSNPAWHALTVPASVLHGRVMLPHYTWLRSRDGRWSEEAPAIAAYPTPDANGYTLSLYYVPLDWQLQVLRFVGPGLSLTANVRKTLAGGGVGPYFSFSTLGWSFVYPSRDIGRRGWIEAKFAWGHDASTWVRSREIRLRG